MHIISLSYYLFQVLAQFTCALWFQYWSEIHRLCIHREALSDDQSSHGVATRVHGFATRTKALAREIPPATQAKSIWIVRTACFVGHQLRDRYFSGTDQMPPQYSRAFVYAINTVYDLNQSNSESLHGFQVFKRSASRISRV